MMSFLCLNFFLTQKMAAQTAASYLFSTNTAVLQEGLPTPTTLFGVNVDDAASPLNPIGFTFNFCGTNYTQFSVSTNGYVSLGVMAPTTWGNALGSAVTFPAILPLWDDTYTAGNSVRYQVKGLPPNRKLVIDWELVNCCTPGAPDKHYQVWLQETTNVISFVYDFGANLNSATVGIATSTTDYKSVTTSSHTSSSVAINDANNSWPGVGRSYVFSPPFPPTQYDPAVTAINVPTGNCFTANETVSVQVCNLGTSNILLGVNPVTVTLNVVGPTGTTPYVGTLSTGSLNALAASCQFVTFNNVNMLAGGNYSFNTTLSISGVTNGYLHNDSLAIAEQRTNFRPDAGPDYQLCQYGFIPFGQGLSVSGCAVPLQDSITITFTITGPCNDGNNDATSCQFATGVLPSIIPGASFTGGTLRVTNLATISASWMSEMRFNIYGSTPSGVNLFSPGLQAPGSTANTSPNFTYTRPIPAVQLANMYTILTPGDPVRIGYWESFNDVAGGTDININGGGTTVATLKMYYTYVPASYEWYDVPVGGTNLYSLSPFNPLSVTNAVVNNSNTTGTYTFYAACSGLSTCRIPVNLVINPTPSAFQDTLSACEFAVSSNSAIFDLTTMNNAVSGNNALASVQYYFDEPLIAQISNLTNDTSSTNFVYSKVFYPSTGCFSSDSLLLKVNTLPDFGQPIVGGNACAPSTIDVASLINQFSTVPFGSDTLYYEDPGFTSLHPNPHSISTADTVYLVLVTNSTPACSDTMIAYIDIGPASNHIANQDVQFNYSVCGTAGCNNFTLIDGQVDTLRSSTDCKKVAAIFDVADGTSLGSISVCEEIDCSTQFHNGQPYVNRNYQIVPTNNDSAMVCLYFLDDDFQQYNASAAPNWPALPTALSPGNAVNLAITKVDNGDLNTPGHIATAIPNSMITTSYDPATTVWTVCFPVSGFSYFYAHSQNPLNIPLPVSLLSFTGRRDEGTSILNWSTSSEQNNSHFILEHSRDGKLFNDRSGKIASKGVHGNSSVKLDYSFTDMTPNNGHNYYRLQQHDMDGRISYSEVVDVYFGNESMVNLYPNPVKNELYVSINTTKSTIAKLKMMDATGRVVRAVDMQLTPGQNQTQVSMEGLAAGIYLIKISNGQGLDYTQTIRKD